MIEKLRNSGNSLSMSVKILPKLRMVAVHSIMVLSRPLYQLLDTLVE